MALPVELLKEDMGASEVVFDGGPAAVFPEGLLRSEERCGTDAFGARYPR